MPPYLLGIPHTAASRFRGLKSDVLLKRLVRRVLVALSYFGATSRSLAAFDVQGLALTAFPCLVGAQRCGLDKLQSRDMFLGKRLRLRIGLEFLLTRQLGSWSC